MEGNALLERSFQRLLRARLVFVTVLSLVYGICLATLRVSETEAQQTGNSARRKLMASSQIPMTTLPEDCKGSVSLTILLDKSRSMAQQDWLTHATKALRQELPLLRDAVPVSLVAFDKSAFVVWRYVRPKSIAERAISRRLDSLFPSGTTRFLPAFEIAKKMAESSETKCHHFLVISDGEFSEPSTDLLKTVQEGREQQQISTTVVLVSSPADVELFRSIARNGRGVFLQCFSPNNLAQGFHELFSPLR